MFQFEQDVDTSQSVTLKADECKAAAFGVVTGEVPCLQQKWERVAFVGCLDPAAALIYLINH